jgi:hypothetical protein
MQPTDEIGFDGNKQVKGRQRHVLTDTLGLILCGAHLKLGGGGLNGMA